jgi:hypothetical protein
VPHSPAQSEPPGSNVALSPELLIVALVHEYRRIPMISKGYANGGISTKHRDFNMLDYSCTNARARRSSTTPKRGVQP